MSTYILQHVPFETPGIIEEIESYTLIKIYENGQLPSIEEVSMLIILGGPMSVSDSIPWLEAEKIFIKELIKAGKPILGICLGAQLIAEILGAKVNKNSKGKEVGFFQVKKVTNEFDFLPNSLDVLHWHGDTFELPHGSKRLYSTDACSNQAFIYNSNVLGLQFHLEMTKNTLLQLVEEDKNYIEGSIYEQTAETILNTSIPSENKKVLADIIKYLKNK
ncbi:type 1 glutamine amidotransferase [Lysinibacillus sp. NPDC097195]|uniref:type 1 glutamine amidotransferase n=1 Tax=Lysinibacillus sp. NPDC097195 TaxID=3364141 RepID=UPI003825015F